MKSNYSFRGPHSAGKTNVGNNGARSHGKAHGVEGLFRKPGLERIFKRLRVWLGSKGSGVLPGGLSGEALDLLAMDLAIAEAKRAHVIREVPVGCVIVHEGKILASAHNLREVHQDPTAHAEVVAIRQAAKALGTWRLSGATVYVTLEPCPMCAGALVNARVDRVVFGADDPKAGATGTLYNIGSDLRLNHRFALTSGVRRDECAELLRSFFGQLREERRARKALG